MEAVMSVLKFFLRIKAAFACRTIVLMRAGAFGLSCLALSPTQVLAQSKPEMAGTPSPDVMSSVAASGPYIYAAGWTGGSLDGPNVGASDIFVRRYDAEGDILWGRQFG